MLLPRSSKYSALLLTMLILLGCVSNQTAVPSSAWARRTLRHMTLRQKVAQMMVYHTRLDYLQADSKRWQEIVKLIETDGIGTLHVWGGTAASARALLNEMQRRSRIPILVQADLEYGLDGRFKGGTALPWPMALTATGDPNLAFEAGRITAEEGRALGIQLALAPVVDVNNNPDNPIINTRSFGEDPDQVITYASRFMQGLRSHGMLATAKHFPGHGDTQTDSHSALAKIPEDSTRLWSVELKPFQAMIDGGVDLVMVGHLDAGIFQEEPGVPATLSPFMLQDILRDRMGFRGTIITDAMAMGGITRGYSDRYALIQTIKAGADIVIQNYDYKLSVDEVVKAVQDGLISESRIDASVLRILTLKSRLGLDRENTVSLKKMMAHYGTPHNQTVAANIMQKSITLVRDSLKQVPLQLTATDSIYIIDIKDRTADHDISTMRAQLQRALPRTVGYAVDNSDPPQCYSELLAAIPDSALVIANVFSQTRMKKNRVQLPTLQDQFIRQLNQKTPRLIVTVFGTPYLLRSFPDVRAALVCYSSQRQMQSAAAQALLGTANITGHLPVAVPNVAERGTGLVRSGVPQLIPRPKHRVRETQKLFYHVAPEEVGADPGKIMPWVNQALQEHAWPGGVLLAAKDGQIFIDEYFGKHLYGGKRHTYRGDIFDLASVTKVIATTSAAMYLYERGKLNLDTTVVSYLPGFQGPDSLNTALKRTITIKQLLTHTAGLKPFKTFYKMEAPSRAALVDSVLQSELDTLPGTRYRYSDIGLITLGKVLEKLAGTDLKTFTDSVIFRPLAMTATGYLPKAPLDQIVPTEYSELENGFIHGHVHDENSYALGGITGHAGLFSTDMDLARFAQMMLNKGSLGDTVIFQPETVELFTHRANLLDEESSRCLGWDSPSETASGGVYLSANSFGHTGFTGTSIWIDPDNQIFVILLTNAVNPDRKYKYPNYFDWRQRIHAAIYESLGFSQITPGLEWRERWQRELDRRQSWWYKLLHPFKS